jgi:hypothetical protein
MKRYRTDDKEIQQNQPMVSYRRTCTGVPKLKGFSNVQRAAELGTCHIVQNYLCSGITANALNVFCGKNAITNKTYIYIYIEQETLTKPYTIVSKHMRSRRTEFAIHGHILTPLSHE